MADTATTFGVSTAGVALIALVWKALQNINHKRLVSKCCGRKIDLSVDVVESAPSPEESQNPPPPLQIRKETAVESQDAVAPTHGYSLRSLETGSKQKKVLFQQSEEDTTVPLPTAPTTVEAKASE